MAAFNTVGAICELIWIFSFVATKFVDREKSQAFYQKHKILGGIHLSLCIFGFLFFFGQLIMHGLPWQR